MFPDQMRPPSNFIFKTQHHFHLIYFHHFQIKFLLPRDTLNYIYTNAAKVFVFKKLEDISQIKKSILPLKS